MHPVLTHGLVPGHLTLPPGHRAYRRRGTDDWLIMVTLSGRGLIVYPGGQLRPEAQEVVLYEPRTPHDYGAGPDAAWEILWAHFLARPEWSAWLHWPVVSPGLRSLRLNERRVFDAVVRGMEAVVSRYRSPFRHNRALALTALEEVILRCDSCKAASEMTRLDERVRTAMEFMCANTQRRLKDADVARACGLSVSRLVHLFREQAGTSMQQFLERQRMRQARERLAMTAEPVSKIAYALGYETPFYFTRRFTRHAGMCPRDYRRAAQGGSMDGWKVGSADR
ncbi:MAG: helix-turn-helix domain-containing protein [Kiritimatiellae bacterium]|nr:helix-turn-helix domain-containing protein [Kiritimatiellia bacterium]